MAKEKQTTKTVNVYVVRHAESRYNEAKKKHDLVSWIGETDHGLSEKGVRQCINLNSTIRSAAASGCNDAKLILSRELTLSSPFSRAILTAHLALPLNRSENAETKYVENLEDGGLKPEDTEVELDDGKAKSEDGEEKTGDSEGNPEDGKTKPEDGEGKTGDSEGKPEGGEEKPEEGKGKSEDGESEPEDGESEPEDGEVEPEDSDGKGSEGDGCSEVDNKEEEKKDSADQKLEESKEEKIKVEDAAGNDSKEEEKKEQQNHHKVVTLPDAREACLIPIFCNDSIGTPRDQIHLKISAEFAAAKKVDEKDIINSLPHLEVDTSRVTSETWWNIGEKESVVSERLGKLLCSLYDEADGSGNTSTGEGAVVLVAHSRVIRTLIRDYGDDGAENSTLSQMKDGFVDNCTVVRLTLKANLGQKKEGGRTTTPPHIVDAALLFGTGLAKEKPKKKRMICF
uniref:Uncharacterized protein n=1 Tax=Ditylum brightwellii TaxID=49249 RepID=A0A6V2CYU4_9STRA